jgi:aminoglycoside phosphotransferase (APT) family kinase protein
LSLDVAALVPGPGPKRVVPLLGGWTSETCCVDDVWIVQIGHTSYAAQCLRHQLRTLPLLAKQLGVPIPGPELACEAPTAIRYRRIEGTRCDAAAGDAAWPEQLGAALGQLHALAPHDVGLTTPAAPRERAAAQIRRQYPLVAPRLSSADRARVDRFVESFLEPRLWDFAPCPVHADLGPEHVLVSASGELCGVIDWEEWHVGDPALDFGWWLHQRPEIGARMLARYGRPTDATFRERARGVYALMPWYDVEHGVESGDEDLIAEGLAGIRARLLAD